MGDLTSIVRATVEAYGMLPAGSVVLALVSGGADSVAMLRLLAEGAVGGPFAALAALHINHLLRGEEADADESFVVDLCASLGVPCRVIRYDVAAYAASSGCNLEDAGRRIRYTFAERELDTLCDVAGAAPARGRIAVAHTQDDAVETFLMRLATGAGARGLRGIPPVRGRIVRPLIETRRADLRDHLRAVGQSWREDPTNADTTRLRAWVRHELEPLLTARNPAFMETAARMLRILGEEDDLLQEMADAFARDFTTMEGARLGFERSMMRTLSRPMARRTVRSALVRAFPEASRIEFEHIEALVDGIERDAFARDLPFGLRAEVEYGTLYVFRRGDTPEPLAPCLLEWPGTCDLAGAGTIRARLVTADAVRYDPHTAFVDADLLANPLVIDGPRAGDRMRPLGLGGTKKLQDLLVDATIAHDPLLTHPTFPGFELWLDETYHASGITRELDELG